MDQKPNSEESLRQEFEALGRNLVDALRSAWESPETKRMRDDVINGLSELGTTLRREADNLANSDAAEKVRTGVNQAAEKVRAPEVQNKMRNEVLGALRTVNTELQRMIERMSEQGTPETTAAGQGAVGETDLKTPASDVSMGDEAVANESVPDLTDEDPYAGIVTPERTPAEPAFTQDKVVDEIPTVTDEDPFGKSIPPQNPEQGAG
jgi:hypothetical protein